MLGDFCVGSSRTLQNNGKIGRQARIETKKMVYWLYKQELQCLVYKL